jgi:RimJ/RimL family protein N-acetyltransferase
MLRTDRLDLIPATSEHLRRELLHPQELGLFLGANHTEEWPPGEYGREATEFLFTKLQESDASAVGWYVWYAVTRTPAGQRETLVAAAGFFGPPCDGVVEIGFSVIPSARGRGFAAEIVTALADYAFASGSVAEVIARTTLTNIASISVLRRAGLRLIGPGEDPGVVRFHLHKPANREY